MWGELDASGLLARVVAVSGDDHQLHVEYRNGTTARISNDEESFAWSVGDLLLFDPESGAIEIAPSTLWPEDHWIGVVCLEVTDGLVVEIGGRYRFLAAAGKGYKVGNTVEGAGADRLLRVLDEGPIRVPEPKGVDAAAIAGFLVPEEEEGPDYSDFGGLHEVVERAKELIELPLRYHDALAKIGARPIKGVLFTGPPGTGKTMLARIIANRAGAKFYEIRGPEIFSKWYGESEGLLRGIFDHAREQDRSIIFFDEIDSVAAQRGESHEASRRVVAQLLSLMDGFTPEENVMVIATTNRPQDIDGALRRPGRLDWEINFPLPDPEDRREILEVWAKKLATAGSMPHELVSQKTELWSGAELAAIWSEAALVAVSDSGREAILPDDYVAGYERVAELRMRSLEALAREGQERER
jgi:transitional endoplasmic reticulum ATPase